MFKILIIPSLLGLSLSVYADRKIIYGQDNRKEIYELRNSTISLLASSIAARVSNFSYKIRSSKKISFPSPSNLASPYTVNLCRDERFAAQPIISDCTGFLVGDDLIATAGHCISDGTSLSGVSGHGVEYCQSHSWLFDFKLAPSGKVNTSNIKSENIYGCKEIIKAKLYGEEDFALIKLDRKVKGRKPLRLRSSGNILPGQAIFAIGHPSGLPMKYIDGANVFNISNSYFSTNLDSFGGNSGSPVFNAKTKEVEGILVRGNIDYVESTFEGMDCSRVNICSSNRSSCLEEDDSIDGEHVTKISRIRDYLK